MLSNEIRSIKALTPVSVTTASTLVVGRTKNRYQALIQNTHGSIVIKVGSKATLDAGGGVPVAAGAVFEYYGSEKLYAKAASSTVVVNIIESLGAPNGLKVYKETAPTITSARGKFLSQDEKRFVAVVANNGSNTIVVGTDKANMTNGISIPAASFRTLWGGSAWYAIAGGTSEVQTLTITGSPSGGTYTLAYGSDTRTLAWDANAAAIQAALESIQSIGVGNVVVTGGSSPYTITFGGELAAKDVTLIVGNGAGITPRTNEVQQVATTGSPAGGTFTLTYSGQTTATIPYNATALQVQTALENLSNIAVGDVLCAGGPLPATPVTVTFQGALAGTNVTQMTEDHTGLTGGTSPTVAVSTTTPGVGTTTVVTVATPGVSNSVALAIREERRAI